jgi:hypothetical protein
MLAQLARALCRLTQVYKRQFALSNFNNKN